MSSIENPIFCRSVKTIFKLYLLEHIVRGSSFWGGGGKHNNTYWNLYRLQLRFLQKKAIFFNLDVNRKPWICTEKSFEKLPFCFMCENLDRPARRKKCHFFQKTSTIKFFHVLIITCLIRFINFSVGIFSLGQSVRLNNCRFCNPLLASKNWRSEFSQR